MKKFLLAIMAISVTVFTFSTAHAFAITGEEQVMGFSTYDVPTSDDASEMYAVVNKVSSKMDSLNNKLTTRMKALEISNKENATSAEKLAEQMVGYIEAKEAHDIKVETAIGQTKTIAAEAVRVAGEAKNAAKGAKFSSDGTRQALHAEANNLGDQICKSTTAIIATNIAIAVVVVLVLGGLIAWLIRRRGNGAGTNNPSENFEENLSNNLDRMERNIVERVQDVGDTVKERTSMVADIVRGYHEFDPSPFVYDNLPGYRVSFDAVADDECYFTLNVDDTNGSDNPEDFEPQTDSDRKRAKHVARGVIVRFLKNEDFRNTPSGKLVEYLMSLKHITITEKK